MTESLACRKGGLFWGCGIHLGDCWGRGDRSSDCGRQRYGCLFVYGKDNGDKTDKSGDDGDDDHVRANTFTCGLCTRNTYVVCPPAGLKEAEVGLCRI